MAAAGHVLADVAVGRLRGAASLFSHSHIAAARARCRSIRAAVSFCVVLEANERKGGSPLCVLRSLPLAVFHWDFFLGRRPISSLPRSSSPAQVSGPGRHLHEDIPGVRSRIYGGWLHARGAARSSCPGIACVCGSLHTAARCGAYAHVNARHGSVWVGGRWMAVGEAHL